jgi:hypothetical protein
VAPRVDPVRKGLGPPVHGQRPPAALQETPLVTLSESLPVAAITISLVSLLISFLGFFRDRARLSAWAEIVWIHRGPGPEDAFPLLRIRATNLGRRPVVLIKLAFHGTSARWFESINQPEPVKSSRESMAMFLDRVATPSLAQSSAMRLSEADVLDVLIRPEDGSRLVLTALDLLEEAEKAFLVDAAGKRYRVRNDTACIKQLLSAFLSGTRSRPLDLGFEICDATEPAGESH